MHTCQGLDPVTIANPVLKATLKGIGNVEGNVEIPKDSMFPRHLLKISRIVNLSSELEVLMFTAILFLFRTLLRVSHVVSSEHTTTKGDVMFNENGLLLRVRSAKNLKSKEKALYIPVVKAKDESICPVAWFKYLRSKFGDSPREELFTSVGVPVLSYSNFNRQFKMLIVRAGLNGNFASHSLRRGGASYMSMKGCRVSEVKERGGWKSDCVYKYICPSLAHKVKVDMKVIR